MLKSTYISTLLVAILCAWCLPLNAQQLAYVKKEGGKKQQNIFYDIKFRQHNNRPARLRFSVNKAITKQSAKLFSRQHRDNTKRAIKQGEKVISARLLDDYKELALQEFNTYVRQRQQGLPEGIQVSVTDGNIRARSDGRLPHDYASSLIDELMHDMDVKWKSLQQHYQERFTQEATSRIQKHYVDEYKKEMYVVTYDQRDATRFHVRIDFKDVAHTYQKSMQPLANAVRQQTQGMNQRQRINFLLAFIQAIPYDILISRDGNASLGFVAPPTLLSINKGDCDTKATALASLLKNLYPDLKLIMILVPDHAFLAINIPAKAKDVTFDYKGRQYVVIETAGPALTPIGRAYPESLPYLGKRRKEISDILEF